MSLKIVALKPKNKTLGFTIVELLVVIVVIGILAAITIVFYTGITVKANESSIKAELANASKKLSMYYAQYESYPTTPGLNLTTGCPTLPNDDTNYCIKFNSGTSITYKSDNSNSYDLTFTKNGLTFTVSQSGTIAAGTPAPTLPESDWITIGTQRWARKNLNVGTRINGALDQSDNGGTDIVEKYCYDDNEVNCTANDNGGLYQWNEAMNYSTSEGSQGICPTGSHVPSDNDWKVLEMYLGMTQAQADTTGFRGTNEGSMLRFGGSSGLNVPFAGNRSWDKSFSLILSHSYLWSSSRDGDPWVRNPIAYQSDLWRGKSVGTSAGYSVRCLGN